MLLLIDWQHLSTTTTSQGDERFKGDLEVESELMVSKRVIKLSKRVSKLKSDSKNSSSFHSSLNCGIVVLNASRHDLHHFVAQ